MKIVRNFLALVPLMVPTAALLADDEVHPFISDEFSLQVGAFLSTKDHELSVNASVAGAERQFDWETATGIDEDESVFMLEGKWRFGEKWSFRAQYYESSKTERAILEESVLWRSQVILEGSNVTAGTDFSLFRTFFGRSFDKRANVDAGIGLGLHWLEIGAFIQPDLVFDESFSAAKVSGPLPNIGGWYYYSPSPKWFLGGRLDWLDANIDEYSGGIINISAGVNYQLFRHFGIGVKYQSFGLNVDVKNDKWNGSVDLTYDGPYIYLSGNW